MRFDLTDIVLVVDRSGSMESCREDAEGGINTFITEQKAAAGEANLTLVQFDTAYDFVNRGTPIKDVSAYKLKPRGWTALYDAVGRAITEVGERLSAIPEDQRPGTVIFVIVTDGQENSSTEFSRTQIRDMITHQREKYNWQFSFIGADESAFTESARLGISLNATAKSISPGSAYRSASSLVGRTRSEALTSNGLVAPISYTDAERQAMNS